MATVYIDTNILVYLLEQHDQYSHAVASILEAFSQENSLLVTSVITITEFLAGTTSSNLETLHRVPRLQLVALDETLAEQAAQLQRQTGLQIGDAIHLATALHQQASLLFTNDKLFAKQAAKFIKIKTLS